MDESQKMLESRGEENIGRSEGKGQKECSGGNYNSQQLVVAEVVKGWLLVIQTAESCSRKGLYSFHLTKAR
jgi:hypothetical protein